LADHQQGAAGELIVVEGSLNILMLEDVPEEAELVQRELRRGGVAFVARRVHTRADFVRSLDDFAPDLVLADSKLPAFDGRSALELATRHVPRIPVIMVTGQLGDEAAVEFLMAGASDYVLKDRLARLGSAVRGVMQAEDERRNRERLERALRDATYEERRRLAKELHDGLGQELTGLALLAEGLLMQAANRGASAPAELERLAHVARHATRTCREIAHGMSPLGGARGLPEALRDLAARLCGPPGPEVSICLSLGDPVSVPREASEHLYRIAQEALANAIKHSGAGSVQVWLDINSAGVRLKVIDDGCGPQAASSVSEGMGLSTMRDRAEAIGGRLTITSRPERSGTAVICEVPLGAHSTARHASLSSR
jgi:two-component system, NarL family, sensor histidine kinase UhpB